MSYYSSMCSPYHKWFIDAGYPQLDIVDYEDGSWAIIQYLNSPIIPCLTKWQHVLQDIRHQIKTPAFCEYWAKRLDPTIGEYRAHEQKKSDKVIAERDAADRFKADMVDRKAKAILKNEGLCERIVKNGLQEMTLPKILKHIPRSFTF